MNRKKLKKNQRYQIEKILKSWTRKGKRQLLIGWLGYTSDFDFWIPNEVIHKV